MGTFAFRGKSYAIETVHLKFGTLDILQQAILDVMPCIHYGNKLLGLLVTSNIHLILPKILSLADSIFFPCECFNFFCSKKIRSAGN